jgi:hypothetical protein
MALINVKYRVNMMESERGWGQDYWHNDFDTREEAEAFMKKVNGKLTELVAPDYYIKALSIEMIEG